MGQDCSDLLQNRGKIQGKLFQNRGKWRIFCTKKGASDECFVAKKGANAPLSLLYMSVILYQNQFTCLSVQLHQCNFIRVTLYQCCFISALLSIDITLYMYSICRRIF